MDAAYSFAKHLVNTKYEDIPGPAIEAAKKEILDLLGVAMGGSSKQGVKELLELIAEWGGKEEGTVLCFGNRVPAPNAAQVNATMGHALDYDDTGDGPVHCSVVIVPTCLAAAERKGKVSGKEFVSAVALGVDMHCRLGAGFRGGVRGPTPGGHPGAGWHLTPVYGFIAAAGVSGRIFGLDENKMINALGIAYHQCAGNGQAVVDGALTKRMGPGFAARGGMVAALMAEKGITGAPNCLEGECGLFTLYHQGKYDSNALTADLGKVYKGTNVEMKPYPCCKGTHGYVEATMSLVKKHNIVPGDVREIMITCPGQGALSIPLEVKAHPRNLVDSQFSIPWAVAVVIARKRAGIADFTEEAIASRDILDVADKIKLDASGEGGPGAMTKSGVRITMRNGQTYSASAFGQAPGGPQEPLPFSVYENKFRDCVSYSVKKLSDKTVDTVIQLVKDLERVDDVREIISLLS